MASLRGFRSLPRSLCVDAQYISASNQEPSNILNIFTAHQVEAMRRDAKKQARATNAALSRVLGQIAGEHGYRNWSLLQKNDSIAPDQPQSSLFRRTSDEVAMAMHVVPESWSGVERRRPAQIARDNVRALDEEIASAANAIGFAIAYVESILAQPRLQAERVDFGGDRSPVCADISGFAWQELAGFRDKRPERQILRCDQQTGARQPRVVCGDQDRFTARSMASRRRAGARQGVFP